MSPTIFSASDVKKEARQKELEQQLQEIKKTASKSTNFASSTSELETSQQTPAELEKDFMSNLATKNDHDQKDSNDLNNQDLNSQDLSNHDQPHLEKSKDPKEYSEVMRREKRTTNPLASFIVRPPGVKFINQHNQEQILLVLRQHPVVNLRWIFLALVMVIAPFVILPIVTPFLPVFDWLPGRFQFFSMVGWYLLFTAYSIENFLYWYFNLYIITDERIIDVDFISLIYRSVSEAKLDKIEDVTATTAGVLGGVFNYGDVNIQTAAEKREFEFSRVPQPSKVTKFLNELILEEEREKIEGRVM